MTLLRHRLTIRLLVLLMLLYGCSNSTSVQTTENSNATPDPNLMGGAIQLIPSLSKSVTTIAGVQPGSADGIGTLARFSTPRGIATDGVNIYVPDSGNHIIRRISLSTREVTTLAGAPEDSGSADGVGANARFNDPQAIAIVGEYLFVADRANHSIRKVAMATGEVTTFAGKTGTSGSTDGTGTVALFTYPSGIASYGTTLYVADAGNHVIRKIDTDTREVKTLAGTASISGSIDGAGTVALFNAPLGITADQNNIYVADTGNGTIRKIEIGSGAVTTIAGIAGVYSFGFPNDGIGSSVAFYRPSGITMKGTDLFVTDGAFSTIRKIDTLTGTVTTIAGRMRGSADGIGLLARFNSPQSVANDGSNIYVADTFNNTIRKISISDNTVTTLAGKSPMGTEDGAGIAARFNFPRDITTDGTFLYITDNDNNAVRKMSIATGNVTTMAKLPFLTTITTDGVSLFVATRSAITKISIRTGEANVLAGASGFMDAGYADGIGPAARFKSISGLTNDSESLYVVDNCMIRKVTIDTGAVTTLAGASGVKGYSDGKGTAARFFDPVGITTDGTYLYVTDRVSQSIRRIVISSGEVTTLPAISANPPYTALDIAFYEPYGITTDGHNLYITDRGCETIRKMVIATGEVTTLGGKNWLNGSADGIGSSGLFNSPSGITTDGKSLFVTDSGNNTIRKIE